MGDARSFTGKVWDVPAHGMDTDAVDLVERLRRERGLPESDAAFAPHTFPDSAKAAARVHKAMEAGERIGVFGDYDCDGITSTCQLVRYFRRHEIDPVVILPHRVHDGYGIKPAHIAAMAQKGVTLLITVDTGIVANEAMERARDAGMDVIILDHHHVGPTLPRATAILHPALDPLHPKPHPAAAGVTFSFLHTLEDGRWDGYEIDLVLATLGTVADVVPLLGNNRQLVREGLAALPYLPDCPLRSLLLRCGGKGGGGAPTAMTSADIGYRVAPRINAAGRMADPTIALRALLDGGPALQELELLNTQRQQTTISCLEHALAGMGEHRDPLLCIASEGYAPGILGLLASKLTERYGRPSLIACIRGEECSASARSPECYNIVEGLSRYKHLLSTFGGHAQAAGCTFPLSALGALQDGLMADIAARTQAEDLLPRLSVHASITPSLVPSLAAMLPSLEPFGKGNPEPLFLLSGITLTGTRQVGSEKQHIQAQIGASKLIGFQLGSLLAHTSAPVDLLCRIGMNAWNGCEEVQLFLQDMRAHAKSAEPVLV